MLMNDRISELPDDILTYVLLPYLTMKDAGRTSVLSKRWKRVWAYIPTLIFDSPKIKEPKYNYFYWVNQVISLHKAPILDDFRVRLDITSRDNVFDNWFRFAMEKKVKRLEIDLLKYYGFNSRRRLCYAFPQSSSCDSLTSLKLGSIDVTGEILESVLRNCLALDCLSVNWSQSLVELKVGGHLLKLKSLIIADCYSMKRLEICAPNLVSACYIGLETDVQFKNTPKLAQVSFGKEHADNLIHCFSDLSSYLSQIEVLTLCPHAWFQNIILPTEDLVFPSLRKLDVTIDAYAYGELFLFRFLMKACPFLLHFTLQLNVRNRCDREVRAMRWTPCPHYHLKTLEIVGFSGDPIEMEIAVMLIKTAVVLDKITVDPVEDHHRGIDGRKCAEEIRPLLKPGTELEIL